MGWEVEFYFMEKLIVPNLEESVAYTKEYSRRILFVFYSIINRVENSMALIDFLVVRSETKLMI